MGDDECDDRKFRWGDVDDDDIVVRSVGMIAVYRNPHGDVVIRQDGTPMMEHDSVVIVPVASIGSLVTKLSGILEEE